jgi:uncharacterized OB-fold protein
VPYTKIIPVVTPSTEPFFEAARNREVRMPKCRDCGHVWFPLAQICPRCLSVSLEWIRLSGRGRVKTWAIYHRAFHPGWADDVPYNVTQVNLDGGPAMLSNIVDIRNEELYEGMLVEAVFEDIPQNITLIKFRPV